MATAYDETREREGIEGRRRSLATVPPERRKESILDAARPIINRLDSLARQQIASKRLLEQRWLLDLSAYFGKYDTKTFNELKAEQLSTAFIKLTRHKTNSWSARLGDLLFPADAKNWAIQPTPVPKLATQAQEALKRAANAVEVANETEDPEQQQRIVEIADTFADAARQARAGMEEAKKRCSAMERAIDDQLVEADYTAQCRRVIEDGCRLGTGILKGPITSHRLRQQWREKDGVWALVQVPDPLPEFRRVDPWHFFPDMSAGDISEAEFTFERHLPTRKDLKRLARKLGFNKEAVGRLLEEGPKPLGLDIDHLTQLRAITGEGEEVIDRYAMWEYHGALECDEIAMLLRAAGQDEKAERFEEEKDPLEDYRVIIHFCGNEILKIAPEYPLDSGESLYSVWNFERGETSVFGLGVPAIMTDSQNMVNGGTRMLLDNAALSVGPQVVVNRAAITPQDGSWGLRPLKVWLLSSTMNVAPQIPAFQAVNIPINTAQIQQIIELGMMFMDLETGMPQLAQGEQGDASKTLGGMSMLFNSANVVFRRIVKMWDDDLTKPTVRRAYDWNMQFNPDEAIKGDMQVDARGTSVLLVREIQSQTLMQLATNWTTHPVIGPWFAAKPQGVRPLLEKVFQTTMIDADDIIATKEEFDQFMQKQAQSSGQEESPDAYRLQVAQMQAESQQAIAQLRAQTEEKIANMRMEVEIAKLSATTGMTEQEIRAKFGIEELKIGSQERLKAAEIAVEERRAKQAVAQGESASQATGKGVG